MSTPRPRRFTPVPGTGLDPSAPDDDAVPSGPTPRPAARPHPGAAATGPWSPASTWQNWGRTQTAHPVGTARPTDVGALQDVLTTARDQGLSVRPVGSGHSFTGIAVATGVQLDLGALAGLREVDTMTGLATFGAGTRLADIPALLAPYGLAMENLGDVDRQTLAGATSTGTHGTGARFGGISTQIRRVRLVTVDGQDLTVSPDENATWWGAVQLGLGALGVLTEITLQCVPAFTMHAVEAAAPFAEVLETWEQRVTGADHFEFYWFPGTDVASTKTNHRLPGGTPLRPRGALTRWVDEDLVANGLYRGICALGSRVRAVVPPANALAARLMARNDYVEPSHQVFVASRNVRFREMEFAVPRAAVPDVVRELADLVRRRDLRISFPVEVRSAAADDLWLSTAHGRDSGYVAVHQYYREDPRTFFRAAQDIFRAHEGRPHWGKMHTLGADTFAEIYPRFGDFVALRDDLDPERTLANPYLERVLGR
ncbi:D-arabinono-1,4-lactone oxidase [Luteimicrobium subarcticum]|uniref:FAD-linked oxidoreductase n=1 Tax=Luteimicrobium subarcticum TaxID=620910 RepID=A0A2M8WUM2_9MICO|nr:D-arabinono-1,4-lactone oxidase [Luteimicrobium subarcticum]PJI94630.1 FAD-linked oxidoreductase [Luteimicrobium subarcticum]